MKPKWKGPSLVMAMVALTLATILSPAVAERRVALVVGNAAYEKVGVLYNPGNDARRIASTLRTLGFEIVGGGPLVDLNKAAMDRAVLAFGNAARDADVALFFYSGHGAQIAGTNYLVPTDGVLTRPADADFTMFNANLVMRQLEASRARLKMMILDACRNNPFVSQGTKDVLPGLAQMQAPAGTVIGFATQPGNVASDGPRGGNSPYTKALAAIMPLPGRELFTVFN